MARPKTVNLPASDTDIPTKPKTTRKSKSIEPISVENTIASENTSVTKKTVPKKIVVKAEDTSITQIETILTPAVVPTANLDSNPESVKTEIVAQSSEVKSMSTAKETPISQQVNQVNNNQQKQKFNPNHNRQNNNQNRHFDQKRNNQNNTPNQNQNYPVNNGITYKIGDLEGKTVAELREIAQSLKIDGVGELNKHDIILKILSVSTQSQGNNIPVEGILEIMSDGTHAVLRSMHLLPSENDVYVSLSQVRRFNMRMGDFVVGLARLPKDNERYLSLLRVDSINGGKAEEALNRPYFDRMTPIFPNRLMNLETDSETLSTRLIDMLAPIGYGQRGMVVAPPKAGKTWLLKDIANGISQNHPNVHLMVVLIAERPEEVTDMARFVKGEVFAANFDEAAEVQVKTAELSLERAKRMVESGKDVVILLDSITRLARAYNVVMPTSGRTLSGGMDPIALYPPKRFFGAARNFENGKSLTIIATALVDTGSKMDDVVFEEFKGTGNMELHLDRSLTERRIYPAINIKESSTRNEVLLLGKDHMAKIWGIRRLIDEMKPADSILAITDRLKKTKSNQVFLDTIHDII